MVPWCVGDTVICLQSSKATGDVDSGPNVWLNHVDITIGWEGTVSVVDEHKALIMFDCKQYGVSHGFLQLWIDHTDFHKFSVKDDNQGEVRGTPDDLNAKIKAVGGF